MIGLLHKKTKRELTLHSKTFWQELLMDDKDGRPLWDNAFMIYEKSWAFGSSQHFSFSEFALLLHYTNRLFADVQHAKEPECRKFKLIQDSLPNKGVFSDSITVRLVCGFVIERLCGIWHMLLGKQQEHYKQTHTIISDHDSEILNDALRVAPDLMEYLSRTGVDTFYKYEALLYTADAIGISISFYRLLIVLEQPSRNANDFGARSVVVLIAEQIAGLSLRPNILVILDENHKRKLAEMVAVCRNRYASDVRAAVEGASALNTKVIDPECAIAIAVIELTLAFVVSMKVKDKNHLFHDEVLLYRELLESDRPADYLVHHGNYAEVQDFISFSKEGSGWPNSVPEAEQLLNHYLSRLLLTRGPSATKPKWCLLGSRLGSRTVVLIRIASVGCAPIHGDMPKADLSSLGETAPAWAWGLRPSTRKLGNTYSGYFNGSEYREVMYRFERAHGDEESRRQFVELTLKLAELSVSVTVEPYIEDLVRILFTDLNGMPLKVITSALEILITDTILRKLK